MYVFIADDAMKSYLLKPFSGRKLEPASRKFNYRSSRARRIVENLFGILANRDGKYIFQRWIYYQAL